MDTDHPDALSIPPVSHLEDHREDTALTVTTDRFRNSPRLVLARYLTDLPSLVIGIVGTVVWLSTWVQPWRTIGQFLVGLVIFMIVVGPWIRVLTVRYAVSNQGVQMDSGLLTRRSEFLPWDLVNSVDDRQPWSYRFFGLTEVICAQTGEDGSRITLEALDAERLALFQRFAVHAGATGMEQDKPSLAPITGFCAEPTAEIEGGLSNSPEGTAATPAPIRPLGVGETTAGDERLVYRTRLVDLVLLSLIYGQVIVLVPPLAFGLLEIAELLSLDQVLEDGFITGLGSLPTLVLIVVAVLGIGVAATVLKYHDFTVHALADGRLRIRYGLFSTHQRIINPAAVQGVVWQLNAMEQLTGRVRLSVLTLDSSSQLGGNLVLPSLPRAMAARLVQDHLPRYHSSIQLITGGFRLLAGNLIVAVLLAGVVVGTWTLSIEELDFPRGWSIPICLLALGLATWIGGILRTGISADESVGLFAARRVLLSERVTVVQAARLHGVTALFGPFRDRDHPRAWLPTVHYFSGSPRRVTALRATSRSLAAVQHMVRHDSIPLRG
ncbi:PH domain-containing protein [uncultured Arthrobacter sp.]|uniref:PH domain-containing protein n=1 Tax=uncultured Arthrobacter sp. TaxID=114050 RepID=UPI00262359D8|nr:PH domain-containing protein [uncultured Arthrobacter sp.]